MRSLRFVVPLLGIAAATVGAGQDTRETEAQHDGLNGPVHTLFVEAQQTLVKLEGAESWAIDSAPDGQIEYDRYGYRTRDGRPLGTDGEFEGQAMQFMRDGNGRVIERTISVVPSNQIIEHDVYGPFGLLQSTSYPTGVPAVLHNITYDTHGSVVEDVTLQSDGKPIFRTLFRRRPDGQWTERTLWVNGVLHSYETYDPDSDFQRYEEYDKAGAIAVTFTYRRNRIESYWSARDDPNAATVVIGTLDNGDARTSSCHRGGICNERTRHVMYLDKAHHNPSMIEIRSGDGKVLCRAWYESQMDEHENWTSRKVWLQEGEQGERTLYETDSRTITYWPE